MKKHKNIKQSKNNNKTENTQAENKAMQKTKKGIQINILRMKYHKKTNNSEQEEIKKEKKKTYETQKKKKQETQRDKSKQKHNK